ncbi:MAG: hypothetical protein ACI4TH_09020 [Candidatus Ornithomonoglobus sp.]
MKKILSFIIAAAMTLSLAPQLIFAEEQNMLVDGAIEDAESIPDGSWKPVTGAWKSGLGDSVDIETEIVSGDSTKSAKITNAAIYQAVSLEAGSTYELSFDIYLNEEFDSAKLQWGIFNFNGSWIGTIAGGYNNGTAVTESGFDTSKTGEWQSVKIAYECGETKNYIVDFFYSGTEGLYVDNVSLVLAADEPETPDVPDEGLLTNYGFENGSLSAGDWKFGTSNVWYAQNAALDTETVYAGSKSVKISDGAVGQRVALEAGKSYKLSAYVFSSSTDASFNFGFYNGTKTWPMSNAVKVDEGLSVSTASEWIQYSIVLENASAQDYVVGVYNSSKQDIYFDNFVLEEVTAETPDKVFDASTVNKGAATGDDGSAATAFVTTITNTDTKDNTVSSVYWEITSDGVTKKTGTEELSGAKFTLEPDASLSIGLMVRNLSDENAEAVAVVE